MRSRATAGRRSAATLVDLMISIALLGVLAAIMLPALQQAREGSRASVCKSRLKELCVGLRGYEASHKALPAGARIAPFKTVGVSWLIEILPFLEEGAVHDRYDRRSMHSGALLLHAGNRAAVDGLQLPTMLCPSSPLPPLHPIGLTTSARVLTPHYVGIAGATSHDGFVEARVAPCCLFAVDGEISGGGALPPNDRVRLGEVVRGLSRTLCIAESSDYAYSPTGQAHRVDGGFPMGWVAGAMSPGVPPRYEGSRKAWNTTSVRYELNRSDYELPGILDDRGPNNPLNAPHPGVVHVATLDGSVRALADTLPIGELKRMATRDL